MTAGNGSGEDTMLIRTVFLRIVLCKEGAVSCDNCYVWDKTCLERWKLEMPVGLKVLARFTSHRHYDEAEDNLCSRCLLVGARSNPKQCPSLHSLINT